MSKRVADVVVEALEAAGVRTCNVIVGGTLNRTAHAIDRSEIDSVHVSHEEPGLLLTCSVVPSTKRGVVVLVVSAGVANTAARCEPLHTKKTGHVQTRAADPAAQEITNEDARWIVTALAVGDGAPDEKPPGTKSAAAGVFGPRRMNASSCLSRRPGACWAGMSFLHPVHRSYEQTSYLRDAGYEQSPGVPNDQSEVQCSGVPVRI